MRLPFARLTPWWLLAMGCAHPTKLAALEERSLTALVSKGSKFSALDVTLRWNSQGECLRVASDVEVSAGPLKRPLSEDTNPVFLGHTAKVPIDTPQCLSEASWHFSLRDAEAAGTWRLEVADPKTEVSLVVENPVATDCRFATGDRVTASPGEWLRLVCTGAPLGQRWASLSEPGGLPMKEENGEWQVQLPPGVQPGARKLYIHGTLPVTGCTGATHCEVSLFRALDVDVRPAQQPASP